MTRIGSFTLLACLIACGAVNLGCGAATPRGDEARAAATLTLHVSPMPALAVHHTALFERTVRDALRRNAPELGLSADCDAQADVDVEDLGQAIFSANDRTSGAARIAATVAVTLHCPNTETRTASATAEAIAPEGTADAGRRRAAEDSLVTATELAVLALAANTAGRTAADAQLTTQQAP